MPNNVSLCMCIVGLYELGELVYHHCPKRINVCEFHRLPSSTNVMIIKQIIVSTQEIMFPYRYQLSWLSTNTNHHWFKGHHSIYCKSILFFIPFYNVLQLFLQWDNSTLANLWISVCLNQVVQHVTVPKEAGIHLLPEGQVFVGLVLLSMLSL